MISFVACFYNTNEMNSRYIPAILLTEDNLLENVPGMIIGRSFTDRELKYLHNAITAPVGNRANFNLMKMMTVNSMLPVRWKLVTDRIADDKIPCPLEDLRCSYCLIWHDEITTPLRGSRYRKVYYCNKSYQKKH
jgi:hypothetical protein